MKKQILFLAMTMIGLSSCQQSSNPSQIISQESDQTGIVNGKDVASLQESEAHLAVLLVGKRKEGIATCTGSLIRKDIILTAAHCVQGMDRQVALFDVGGSLNLERARLVVGKVVHENYRPEVKSVDQLETMNDIALLKLNASAPDDQVILSLPYASLLEGKKTTFTAIGYGRTTGRNVEDDGAGRLRFKQLSTEINMASTVFHVEQKEGGVCQGDSGGPAVLESNATQYVIGVVSMTRSSPLFAALIPGYDPCASASIYVNVSSYIDWIQSAVVQLDELSQVK